MKFAFLCLCCFTNLILQSQNFVFGCNTNKWHPNKFYIIYPDMKFEFKLPYEKDQSGVANLLFKNKANGKIQLLDTIKNGIRYYSELLGKYDVIILYNNGKYIKYDGMSIKKNSFKKVNMEKLTIHPCDSDSQYWLTLRSFDTAIMKRYWNYHTPNSKITIRGYIFDEKGEMLFHAYVARNRTMEATVSDIDGYFEFGVDEAAFGFQISCLGYKSQNIELIESSGLFVVLEEDSEQMNMRIGQSVK